MKRLFLLAIVSLMTLTLTACVEVEVEWSGLHDVTINVGDPFDPMAGVSAKVKDGETDLTEHIRVAHSEVNNSTPGSYKVYYEIDADHVPDAPSEADYYGNSRTVTVVAIKPTVKIINDDVLVGDTSYILGEFFEISDPQDGILDLSDIVFEGTYDINVPGEYPITFSVTDSDGNTTTGSFILRIVAPSTPVIEGAMDQVVLKGTTLDLLDGVSASDLEDGDITSDISVDTTFDKDVAGTYTVTYSVTDSDGNQTTVSTTVTVYTDTFPELTVPSDITLFQGDETSGLSILSQISAIDLEDGDITGDVYFTGDYNIDVVGTYPIVFNVFDSDENFVTKTLNVHVVADNAPTLTDVDDIELFVGDSYDPLNGATATDDKDGDITSSIVVTDPTNINTPGTYTVTLTVTDSFGHEVSTTYDIMVKEDLLPVITVDETIEITVGDTLDISSFASAIDDREGDITDRLFIIGMVNTNLPGEYEVNLSVLDSYMHEVTVSITINVVGTMTFEDYLTAFLGALSSPDYLDEDIQAVVDDSIPSDLMDHRFDVLEGTKTYAVESIVTSSEYFGLYWVTFDISGTMYSTFVGYSNFGGSTSISFIDELTVQGLISSYLEILIAAESNSPLFDLELVKAEFNNTVPTSFDDLYGLINDGTYTIVNYSFLPVVDSTDTFTFSITTSEDDVESTVDFTLYGEIDNGMVTVEFTTPEPPMVYPTILEVTSAFEAFLLVYEDDMVSDMDLAMYVVNFVPQGLLDLRPGVHSGMVTITLMAIVESMDVPGQYEVELELNDSMMTYPFYYTIFAQYDNELVVIGFVEESSSEDVPSTEDLTTFFQGYLDDIVDTMITFEVLNEQAGYTLPSELFDLRPDLSSGMYWIENLLIINSELYDDEFVITFDVTDGITPITYEFVIWAYDNDPINFGFITDDTGASVPTLLDLQGVIDAFITDFEDNLVSNETLDMEASYSLTQTLLDLRVDVLAGTTTITSAVVTENELMYGDFILTITYFDGVETLSLELDMWAEENDGVITFGFYSYGGGETPESYPTASELLLELDYYFLSFEDSQFSDEDMDLYVYFTTPVDFLAMRSDILAGTLTITNYTVIETMMDGQYTLTVSIDDGVSTTDYDYTLEATIYDGFVSFAFYIDME